jgi:hypothetical protein
MERNCCLEGGYGLESQLNRRKKAINNSDFGTSGGLNTTKQDRSGHMHGALGGNRVLNALSSHRHTLFRRRLELQH